MHAVTSASPVKLYMYTHTVSNNRVDRPYNHYVNAYLVEVYTVCRLDAQFTTKHAKSKSISKTNNNVNILMLRLYLKNVHNLHHFFLWWKKIKNENIKNEV